MAVYNRHFLFLMPLLVDVPGVDTYVQWVRFTA